MAVCGCDGKREPASPQKAKCPCPLPSPLRPAGEPRCQGEDRGLSGGLHCCRQGWGVEGPCRRRGLCSQWLHSPGHTRSIPGAPAGWPRIAGIPGEGTSSPGHPVFCLSLSQPFRIGFSGPSPSIPAGASHTDLCVLASARPGLPGDGASQGRGEWFGKVQPSPPPQAFLALCLHFSPGQWRNGL